MYSGVKAFNTTSPKDYGSNCGPTGRRLLHTARYDLHAGVAADGYQYDPNTVMLSEDAASEIVEHVGDGPAYLVGENNRQWLRRSGPPTGGR